MKNIRKTTPKLIFPSIAKGIEMGRRIKIKINNQAITPVR